MGINKIVYGGVTKLDISNDTVTPSSLLEGFTAHDNTGALIVGTASGGGEGGNVWQDANGYLHLDDESGIDLQTKSVTPTEAAQTVTPDAGYYALDKVNVSAISSTYVGSGITRRSSTDLTNSLPSGVYRFIVPAGYYAEQATKDIAKYDLPTPTISIDTATGEITATNYLGNSGFINGATKTATEQLTLRDSTDLTVSGATVTAPAGYYGAAASKSVTSMTLPTAAATSATSGYTKKATIGRSTSKQYINIGTGYNNTGGYYEISAVANGSASAPTSISGSTATVSTGTNTLTLTKTVSVTPVVSAGYVSSGTATNSSVSLTASVAINPTPTASGATVTIPAGYYSAQTSKSVASGTAGTPTATKGTVSNHSVNITPSVTNSAGYIAGGTKNGTAVSVSASELVSGTKAITENGTDIDVTNYASVDVAVPSLAKQYTATITKVGSSSSGSNAYVYYPGRDGTQYKNDGDTFVLTEGDIINAHVFASHATCSVFVNDVEVADSGLDTYISYNYTVPAKTNLSITLYPETHKITIEEVRDLISITSNGTYDVSEYDYADVNVSSGGVNVDDYKSIIERTATTPVLPNTLTKIGNYAFHSCTNLALTSLPDGITSIGQYAFYSCNNLALTSLPDGITSIGQYAFRGCTKLALTSLPDGVTSIGNSAFYGCTNIEVLSIPSGVSTISGSTFWGCNKLGTIILRKTDAVCSLANVNALANTPIRGYNSLTGKIYVPSALIESYKTATNWSTIYDAGTVEFLAIEGSEYEE